MHYSYVHMQTKDINSNKNVSMHVYTHVCIYLAIIVVGYTLMHDCCIYTCIECFIYVLVYKQYKSKK